jgi:hypothetical protein
MGWTRFKPTCGGVMPDIQAVQAILDTKRANELALNKAKEQDETIKKPGYGAQVDRIRANNALDPDNLPEHVKEKTPLKVVPKSQVKPVQSGVVSPSTYLNIDSAQISIFNVYPHLFSFSTKGGNDERVKDIVIENLETRETPKGTFTVWAARKPSFFHQKLHDILIMLPRDSEGYTNISCKDLRDRMGYKNTTKTAANDRIWALMEDMNRTTYELKLKEPWGDAVKTEDIGFHLIESIHRVRVTRGDKEVKTAYKIKISSDTIKEIEAGRLGYRNTKYLQSTKSQIGIALESFLAGHKDFKKFRFLKMPLWKLEDRFSINIEGKAISTRKRLFDNGCQNLIDHGVISKHKWYPSKVNGRTILHIIGPKPRAKTTTKKGGLSAGKWICKKCEKEVNSIQEGMCQKCFEDFLDNNSPGPA